MLAFERAESGVCDGRGGRERKSPESSKSDVEHRRGTNVRRTGSPTEKLTCVHTTQTRSLQSPAAQQQKQLSFEDGIDGRPGSPVVMVFGIMHYFLMVL